MALSKTGRGYFGVTQDDLDTCDLIVLVDAQGNYRWSSRRSDAECAAMLRGIANDMEKGRT